MLGKDHGGLYKAPTKEERRRRKAKSRERSDQVDLRFERWQELPLKKELPIG